jgi:hypothetical protein
VQPISAHNKLRDGSKNASGISCRYRNLLCLRSVFRAVRISGCETENRRQTGQASSESPFCSERERERERDDKMAAKAVGQGLCGVTGRADNSSVLA